jgi:hypothetical protein
MNRYIRGAARAVFNAWPLSRFRSFEERLGVGFALMLIFVLCQPLLAQQTAAGESAGRANQLDPQDLPDRARAQAGA